LLRCGVVAGASEVQVRMELKIHGRPYCVTVTRSGFKLVRKGKRKGVQMPWTVFVEDDDAVLYSELQASIRKILDGN
jgi:hypothetical protein